MTASLQPEPWHGTVGGYTNRKCHCQPCLTAIATYSRERRKKARANGVCAECSRPARAYRCEEHERRQAVRRAAQRAHRLALRHELHQALDAVPLGTLPAQGDLQAHGGELQTPRQPTGLQADRCGVEGV